MSYRLRKYLLEALYAGEYVSPAMISPRHLRKVQSLALVVTGVDAYGEAALILTDLGRAKVAQEQDAIKARKESKALLRQLRNRK